MGEIGQHGFLVLGQDDGSGGDFHDDVFRVGAGAVGAFAGTTVLGLEMLAVAVIDQGVEAGHRHGNDRAAASAVAAVGAAELDIFLAPETQAACAAVATACKDLGFIEKLYPGPLATRQRLPPRIASLR